ncbi:MAG TPA: FHA domain-containing serine/threonine-protein kinase [Anaeromyxobacteraceae bacterium]|nr:FHA domain-containing serine/threonine-protein kinase [Anaeromyxobacteraceae bacterium]
MPLIVRVEDSDRRSVVEYAFTRSPVRIGRSPRNDLCLSQRFVSAWHGLVEFDDLGAMYTDLGSTNGTVLNGSPMEPGSTLPLDREAEVVIGSLRFTFPRQQAVLSSFGPSAGPRESSAPSAERRESSLVRGEAPKQSDGRPDGASPLELEPALAPGGITALMKKLAAAPATELDGAWRRILVPGAVIGRFELLEEIGRGSFGVVFAAKDRQLGRSVAFKAVRPGRESQVMFREELLQKEAEAVAQLNHPNIVSLYDAGTCDGGPYLIMELLKGETLRDRMERGPIPLTEAIEIAVEIGWALDHAHGAGVIHRDLKPANVFLCTGGHVKVLDFGIAHVFGVGASKAIGTPAYMAPEQWRQGPQDARTDVFGAAAMTAEMVTGRLPYKATKDWSAVLDRDARPALAAPGAPPQLLHLLRRGLSVNPDHRPRDGHAWLTALLEVHEILDQTPALGVEKSRAAPRPSQAARTMSDETPEPRRAPRTRALVVGALAAVTGLTALVYLLLG